MRIWDKGLINLQEQVYLLYLNDCNQVICWKCLNTGTSYGTPFDIKLAMACALSCMASNIIIAHNHPSGALTPSPDDQAVTDRLNSVGEFLGIKLLDHIIVSRNGYCSFIDKQLMSG